MAVQRIIKLIPYGNPEDRQFVEIVVGGTDELASLADFIGWHIELFSGLTTNGSGLVTVTLAHTPTAIASCFVLTAEAERVVRANGLAGAALTIEKRKLIYDKPATPVSGVTNQPAGVSVRGTSGMSTDATTLSGDALTLDAAGLGNALQADQAHSHTISSLYDHKHTLTFAATSLVLAATEATELAVLYK